MTPVAMATKFDTKSAITRLVYEISPRYFRLIRGFRGQAIECGRRNFKKTDPGCHGNEIWNKMSHNLTCMGNITEMFARSRGFLGLGY